jgi:hypothetical protein
MPASVEPDPFRKPAGTKWQENELPALFPKTWAAAAALKSTRWRAISVEGEFTVHAPPGARGTIEDDGATFALRLPTVPATEMLISRHGQTSESAANALVRDRVRRFLSEHASKASDSELGISLKEWRDENQLVVVQGVATDGDGDWWLVRAYDVGKHYFWLQWTGTEQPLKGDVLQIFESFVPSERWLPKA